MSRVAIVTDSASDLTPAAAAAGDITVVPLEVSFGEARFKAGLDDPEGLENCVTALKKIAPYAERMGLALPALMLFTGLSARLRTFAAGLGRLPG